MRKIEIVASDERLITPSGLSLVGQVLGKSAMIKKPTECEPKNVPSHKGTIVDATFVNAPRQRNSRDENKKSKTVRFLKNGKIPKTKVNSLRKIQTQTGQRRMVNCISGIRIM